MRWFIFKAAAILLIVLLMCLPFFSKKFKFSLRNPEYDKENRWRNLCFVIETVIISSFLICIAPYLKDIIDWFFNLRLMVWFRNLFADRFVYAVNVVAIIATNIFLCVVFLFIKKAFRKILDKYVFTDDGNTDKKEKKTKKPAKDKQKDKNRSESRLRKLRRESVLVFGKGKKDKNISKAEYTAKISEDKDSDKKSRNENDEEKESLSFTETVKKLWFMLVGLFYDADENYEYVKIGAYRFARELKNFTFLVSALYLVICVMMLVPVFFDIGSVPGFYKVVTWIAKNTYVFPVLSIITLFEMLWFVDGEYKEEEEVEPVFFSFLSGLRFTKKADLDKARSEMLSKYGSRYKIKNFDAPRLKDSGVYSLGDKRKAIKNLAGAIKANKRTVSADYMTGIENMLDGKHVLFDASLYSALGAYMLHYLFVTLTFGTRVLFICKDEKEVKKATAYIEAGFKNITHTSQLLWRICDYKQLHAGERPDVLLLTPEQFLERKLFVDGKDFFDELVDVFVLDVDEILTANNYYCLIIAKKLEKATTRLDGDKIEAGSTLAVNKEIRYTFFSNGYVQALGNSVRQFFNLEDAPLCEVYSHGVAAKTDVFVWHTGSSSTLYVDSGANQVALEVQIAKDAGSYGINSISLISGTEVYSSQIHDIPGLLINNCDLSDNPEGYVVVADDKANLPNTLYNYARYSGRESVTLHVVSKPYLFREYFTENAEKCIEQFPLIGEMMCEHADEIRANVIILLCDMINGIEQSEFICRASSILGRMLDDNGERICNCGEEKGSDLLKCISLCYKVAFGEEIDCRHIYICKEEQNTELEIKTFVYLCEPDKLFEKLLERTRPVMIKYVNTQSSEYIPVFVGEIIQNFLPGQIFVRNNRAYTIKEIDTLHGIVVVDDTGPSVNVPMDYIQTRLYTLNKTDIVSERKENAFRSGEGNVLSLAYTVYEIDATVDTAGYFPIEKSVQSVDLSKSNFSKYVNLLGSENALKAIRRSIKSKMLVLDLETTTDSDPRVTYLLSVILHEAMKTVFPVQYRSLAVCPLFDDIDEEEFFKGNTAIRDLYPRIIAGFTDNEKKHQNAGRIRIAIIEDIDGGNRVIDTLVDDGNMVVLYNLLHVVSDFLMWTATPSAENYKYLNFGKENRPELFDFVKLEEILRQFHYDIESSKRISNDDGKTCFFCHKELENGDEEELRDGRIICQNCKDSSIDTFEELDELFANVIGAIKKNTSVFETFPKNITVDFVSTEDLIDRFGADNERLPVAYCNHVTKQIFVEYGLPKCTCIEAMARMITELWQDVNIVSAGENIYYGHIDYVAVQVLTLLQLTNEAGYLDKFYADNDGYAELKELLAENGTKDSFAFLLGKAAEDNSDGSDNDESEEEDDSSSFIADRDPKTMPRYLYSILNDDEKAVYDQIHKAILEFAESTGPLCKEITDKRCRDIYLMVLDDNTDIIWATPYNSSISIARKSGSNIASNIIFRYVMTKSEAKKRKKQIEKAVKDFIKGIKPSMSDYDVALRAHENIVERIDYDSLALEVEDRDPSWTDKPDDLRSIYGVFVNKKAVCAGYAKAFQYLLHRLGIECAYVIGNCHNGGGHAWNMIKLEGDYYYVDVTHDDRSNTDARKHVEAEISHDYFCITTEELKRSRTISDEEQYPVCTAKKCNYFIRNKMYFKEYDAERIRQLIVQMLKEGKTEIALKAASPSIATLLKKRLVDDGGIYDILNSIADGKNYSAKSFYMNEDLNVLHLIIKNK